MLVNAYVVRKLTENVCRPTVVDRKIDAVGREYSKNQCERPLEKTIPNH